MKNTLDNYIGYNRDIQAIYIATFSNEYFGNKTEMTDTYPYEIYFNVNLTNPTIDLDAMLTGSTTLTNRQAIMKQLCFSGFFGYYNYWDTLWSDGVSGMRLRGNINPGTVNTVTRAASTTYTDSVSAEFIYMFMQNKAQMAKDYYVDEDIFRFAVSINTWDETYDVNECREQYFIDGVYSTLPFDLEITDLYVRKICNDPYDPGDVAVLSTTTKSDDVVLKKSPIVYGQETLDRSTPPVLTDGLTNEFIVTYNNTTNELLYNEIGGTVLDDKMTTLGLSGYDALMPHITKMTIKLTKAELDKFVSNNVMLVTLNIICTSDVVGGADANTLTEMFWNMIFMNIAIKIKDSAIDTYEGTKYVSPSDDISTVANVRANTKLDGTNFSNWDNTNNVITFAVGLSDDIDTGIVDTYFEDGTEYVDVLAILAVGDLTSYINNNEVTYTDPITFKVKYTFPNISSLGSLALENEYTQTAVLAEETIGRIKVVPEVLDVAVDNAETTAIDYKYVVEVSEDNVVWTPVYSNVIEHQAVTINLNSYKDKTTALTGVTTTKFNHRFIKIETPASNYVYDCTTRTATLTNGLYLVLKSLQVFNGTTPVPYSIVSDHSADGMIDGVVASYANIATALDSAFSISDVKFTSTGAVVVIIDLGAATAFDKIKIISGEKKDDGSIFGFKYNVSYSTDINSFTVAGATVDPTTTSSGTITIE